jgi:transcriptional regulator with XRE-family HTH domain
MGTLGKYLYDARVARGFDLREAAQQTRISAQYLKALEEEDFSKLPGEVFVKGFLKNYAKFLHLDELEIMQRYGEILQKRSPTSQPATTVPAAAAEEVHRPASKFPLEPVLWAAGIVVVLVLFFFSAFPSRRQHVKEAGEARTAPGIPGELSTAPVTSTKPEKLYLQVVALENTWLLIRTDTSPEKKAMLNKGESLIWSANDRFLLSYGSAGALKLLLNGNELTVDEPKNAVIRDMTIISSGIVNRKIQADNAHAVKQKRKIVSDTRTSQTASAPGPVQPPVPAQPKPPVQPHQ